MTMRNESDRVCKKKCDVLEKQKKKWIRKIMVTLLYHIFRTLFLFHTKCFLNLFFKGYNYCSFPSSVYLENI